MSIGFVDKVHICAHDVNMGIVNVSLAYPSGWITFM